MTPERLMALADAYGADTHRWPVAERAAAAALAARGDPALAAVLAEAAALDALLVQHQVPAPGARLVHAVVASATPAATLSGRWRRLRHAWAGLGLAGLGLAGAMAGAFAVAAVLPPEETPGTDAGTAGWLAAGTVFPTPAEGSEP